MDESLPQDGFSYCVSHSPTPLSCLQHGRPIDLIRTLQFNRQDTILKPFLYQHGQPALSHRPRFHFVLLANVSLPPFRLSSASLLETTEHGQNQLMPSLCLDTSTAALSVIRFKTPPPSSPASATFSTPLSRTISTASPLLITAFHPILHIPPIQAHPMIRHVTPNGRTTLQTSNQEYNGS